MLAALFIILAVVGVGGLIVILRTFRRQDDYQAGPGIVPEEYD